MGFQCIIHQMKGIIFPCLLTYLVLKINIKCKSKYTEMYLFDFYFSIVHISSNNVLDSLKVCMHVSNIYVEGTVSQIIFLSPTFYFMTKNG